MSSDAWIHDRSNRIHATGMEALVRMRRFVSDGGPLGQQASKGIKGSRDQAETTNKGIKIDAGRQAGRQAATPDLLSPVHDIHKGMNEC